MTMYYFSLIVRLFQFIFFTLLFLIVLRDVQTPSTNNNMLLPRCTHNILCTYYTIQPIQVPMLLSFANYTQLYDIVNCIKSIKSTTQLVNFVQVLQLMYCTVHRVCQQIQIYDPRFLQLLLAITVVLFVHKLSNLPNTPCIHHHRKLQMIYYIIISFIRLRKHRFVDGIIFVCLMFLLLFLPLCEITRRRSECAIQVGTKRIILALRAAASFKKNIKYLLVT